MAHSEDGGIIIASNIFLESKPQIQFFTIPKDLKSSSNMVLKVQHPHRHILLGENRKTGESICIFVKG